MSISQTFEVEITGMAYGGSAISRLEDGRTVFVPFANPGERVRLAVIEDKPHYAQGKLLDILRPAPERIDPQCPTFGVCGGCHYQQLPYQNQIEIKASILRDQLHRMGKLTDLPEVEIIPSPDPWDYRNTLQFHLTKDGKLGFQKTNSNETLPIEQCSLAQPALQGIWKQIEFEPDLSIERLSLRCGQYDEILLTLESNQPETPELMIEELPISVVHLNGDDAIVMAGSDHLWIELRDRLFHVSAGAFFQGNNRVAENLVEHLLTHLSLKATSTVLDLYCGGGLYSAFMAEKVAHLIGIESSPAACRDFEINLDQFENVELYEAPAEHVLPYLNIQADIMLVDPPRSGLAKLVRQAIAACPPTQLVYISCDPSTLSRDARDLVQAGFKLEKLAFFDMFPQTYHIESVSYWRHSHP